jgi:hypothetical protein
MKLYIPGYGDTANTRQLREIKIRTDSLQQAMHYKDLYITNLRNVLQGDATVKLDTMLLNIPVPEKIEE